MAFDYRTERVDLSPRTVLINHAFQKIRTKLKRLSPIEYLMSEGMEDSPALRSLAPLRKDIYYLKKYVTKNRILSDVDYGDMYLFTQYDHAFFYKNLFKFLMVCDCFKQRYPFVFQAQRVADLGCGVGTFGLAWQTISQLDQNSVNLNQDVYFIDKHQYQLQFAWALQKIFALDSGLFKKDDIMSKSFYLPRNFVRLGGYLFTSHLKDSAWDKFAIGDALGDINLIIDYKENIQIIKDILLKRQLNVFEFHLRSKVPVNFIQEVGTTQIKTYALVSYKSI